MQKCLVWPAIEVSATASEIFGKLVYVLMRFIIILGIYFTQFTYLQFKHVHKFDIHMSVHCKYNSKLQPTRCNVSWFIYLYRRCTCFRQFLRPSSGARNCIYSLRYCQPILHLAAIVDLIHNSSKQQYWLTIPQAVCTVTCSWWWVEELPETCTASV